MADLTYVVGIEFDVGDLDSKVNSKLASLGKYDADASGHLSGLTGKLGSLASSAAEAVGKVGEAFTGAVEAAGEMALSLGKIGAGVAVGALTYGVTHLNNELEQTQLSLGAIFNAQGFSSDFQGGMAMAADQVAKMKTDVKSLPGDLGQLSDIMKTIATPAAQGGADPDAIRKLAGRGMLVGQILGVQQDVVARELAGLLSGRAGGHNILGTRLGLTGDKAQAFNHEDAGKRLHDLETSFDKYGPAAEAFAGSFVAKFTTLKDNVKYAFLAPVSSPLFTSVKHAVDDVNGFFESHKGQIAGFTDELGGKLAHAFDKGEEEIKHWAPIVFEFAENAEHRIEGIWTKIEPLLSKVGAEIETVLEDPRTFDRIESMLKLYTAVKVGAALMPMAQGAMGVAGLLGGGAAGEAAGAGEALGGVATAAAPAGAALGALTLALYGANEAIHDGGYLFHDAAFSFWSDAKEHLKDTGKAVLGTADTLQNNLAAPLHTAAENGGTVLLGAVDVWSGAMKFGAQHAEQFGNALNPVIGFLLHDFGGPRPSGHHDRQRDFLKHTSDDANHDVLARDPLVRAGGGGGATQNITQNISFNVSTSHEPSRVARTIKNVLAEHARYPTASPTAPNYSARRT